MKEIDYFIRGNNFSPEKLRKHIQSDTVDLSFMIPLIGEEETLKFYEFCVGPQKAIEFYKSELEKMENDNG